MLSVVRGEEGPWDDVRLNELQVIGTHNSYHLEPNPQVMALIKGFSEDAAASIAYSHRTIEDQLGELGIRQLEWDLYADPEGGLFAEPLARKLIAEGGGDPCEPADRPAGRLACDSEVRGNPPGDAFERLRLGVEPRGSPAQPLRLDACCHAPPNIVKQR